MSFSKHAFRQYVPFCDISIMPCCPKTVLDKSFLVGLCGSEKGAKPFRATHRQNRYSGVDGSSKNFKYFWLYLALSPISRPTVYLEVQFGYTNPLCHYNVQIIFSSEANCAFIFVIIIFRRYTEGLAFRFFQ